MTTPSDDDMDLLIGYALDALDAAEFDRAEQLLRQRPELHATVADLRATLDKLPYALPAPEVPADLRDRTLARATGRAERPAAPRAAGAAGALWRRLTLALGGLSAALAVAAALLWGQLGAAQRELATARAELQRAVAEREQVVRVISGSTVLAELAGDRGRATVLRTASGETVLAAQLPPLAEGRVYQLWRIQGDEAPVSGGTFVVGADGAAVVSLPAGADADGTVLAVTDEPGPAGSAGPTSDPLIAGAVGA